MPKLTPSQQPHTFFGHRRKKHDTSFAVTEGRAKGPGLIQQAVNYGKAVVRYHRNHGWMLPHELAELRAVVCHSNQCGKYDANRDKCLHQRCGCTIAEKVTWSTESCPQGLWLAMYGPAPSAPG